MKIAQVISTPPFAWATGGPARVVYDLSKELVKRGHEVTIVTTDLYEPNQRYVCPKNPECIDGINIFRFRSISNLLAWRYKIYISLGLIRYLKNHLNQYDIVHLQDLESLQAVATAKYCQKYGIPYILSTHGSVPKLGKKGGLKWLFDIVFKGRILRGASKIIALTNTEVKQLKEWRLNEDKIEIVSNGIDLSEYDNLPEKGEFRRKYSIREAEKVILYLGRIHKIKGIDLLVNAFADLLKELDNVRLVIVGPDDGFLSTLKKQIEDFKMGDKILITGPLYERNKLEAYVDADVYVLPSIYEIFGITILEACACGTPVIVTDRCGIADIVEKIGYVVEYDKDQLRDAIFKVLSDEGLRRRFGEEGKSLVGKEFGWGKIVLNVEKIYSNLMKK